MNTPNKKTDCEGIDPGTDECADGDGPWGCLDCPKYDECPHNRDEEYYEPTEHDEWMDFDPDC